MRGSWTSKEAMCNLMLGSVRVKEKEAQCLEVKCSSDSNKVT